MKKSLTFLITIILSLALINNVQGALPSDTVWEVRTTGDNTNGGCYDYGGSGTDYSQQNTAQLSLTDLAMTTGGTTLTSATGGFTSAMVDNCIHINSGTNFTAGFYEITGYTDTNTVTIDRDATNGSNASSGSGKVGGALAGLSGAHFYSGHTVYIKSGIYTDTPTLNIDSGGYDNLTIIGYNTTRSDFPKGDNRPLIDGGSNTYAISTDSTNYNQTYNIHNLRFTGGTSEAIYIPKKYTRFYLYNTKIYNSVKGINSVGVDGKIGIFLSEVTGCSDDGIYDSGNNVYIQYSYIHDNTSDGYYNYRYKDHFSIANSIFDSNGGYGIYLNNRSYVFLNNIFYNNTSGGVRAVFGYITVNNIALSNGGYGFYANSKFSEYVFDYNAYYNNTSGGLYNLTAGSHDITTDPSFTDASGGDFTVTSGSPLIGTGFPDDTFDEWVGVPTSTYEVNIGIDQDDNASGGGSVTTGYGFTQ